MQAQWKNERNIMNAEVQGVFIPAAQFQSNFLYRFPYLPEEQCTTTKLNLIYREVSMGT
jgi:hypothetical protein